MRIGIFGTGMVGQALAGRLAELGHDVMIGTRDVAAALARTKPDNYGNPGFGPWRAGHPEIKVGSFPETSAHGATRIPWASRYNAPSPLSRWT